MLPGITEDEGTEQRAFDRPFHPRALLDAGDQGRWLEVGPDRWRGTATMQQEGASMRLVVTVKVISPTRMAGSASATFTVPPRMAEMAGGGPRLCRSIASVQMTWSK